MERLYTKIAAMVACFIIPFVCTILPLKVSSYFEKKGKFGKNVLSWLMCFGGGVFFATFILHMAPESRMIVEYSFTTPRGIDYPLADFIMAMGFFMVLFCEKLVMKMNKKRSKEPVNKCVTFRAKDINSSLPENGMTSRNSTNVPTDIEDLASGNCPLYGSGSCCKDPDEVVLQKNATESTGFIVPSEFSFISHLLEVNTAVPG